MGKIEVDGIQVQGIENLSERENLSEDKIVLEPETGNAGTTENGIYLQ